MRPALEDLRVSLARVEAVVVEMDNNVSAVLADPQLGARYETTRCALAVIVSGLFESFLKDTAENFIRVVNQRNRPFNSLPESMRFVHFIYGAEKLEAAAKKEKASVSSSPKHSPITQAIATKLASTTQVPYELLWEAFSDTQSNPGPDALRDYLKRFGIDDPLQKLAAKTRSRHSKDFMILKLQLFIYLRNECAHTGGAVNIPSTVAISEACIFIDELAEGVVELLEGLLAAPPLV
jgi:hypothetical protein